MAPDHLEDWVGGSVVLEPAVYISVELHIERVNWAHKGSVATSDFIKLQQAASMLKCQNMKCMILKVV